MFTFMNFQNVYFHCLTHSAMVRWKRNHNMIACLIRSIFTVLSSGRATTHQSSRKGKAKMFFLSQFKKNCETLQGMIYQIIVSVFPPPGVRERFAHVWQAWRIKYYSRFWLKSNVNMKNWNMLCSHKFSNMKNVL